MQQASQSRLFYALGRTPIAIKMPATVLYFATARVSSIISVVSKCGVLPRELLC
jgi:hypothetical protein